MAPPISPAATPAATPRCAWAGAARAETARVAAAAMAKNGLFMASPLWLRIHDGKDRLPRRKFHTLLECSMNAARPDLRNVRRTMGSLHGRDFPGQLARLQFGIA